MSEQVCSAQVTTGFTVWLTGLPSSGKTTVAERLAQSLRVRGQRVEILDGDVVRRDLCKDLGFDRAARDANVERVGFVAQLLSRNGVAVIVALISPYAGARQRVRERVARFVEVHVDCAREECERRDVKGLYALARAGKLAGLTGVQDPYEPPPAPEVYLNTEHETVAMSVRKVLAALEGLQLVKTPIISLPAPPVMQVRRATDRA
jgi:adenylylsulfate kinase